MPTPAPPPPPDPIACEVRWAELDADGPAELPLTPWIAGATEGHDPCDADFDPVHVLGTDTCNSPGCTRMALAGGATGAVLVSEPGGSGRFETVELAVGTARAPLFACLIGSTVGWRGLSPAAHAAVAPLPWATDLDGDGVAELILWSRLSYGDSESANALAPIIYRVDAKHARLVREDRRGGKLAARVARLYRDTAAAATDPHDRNCQTAVAEALEHWGAKHPASP